MGSDRDAGPVRHPLCYMHTVQTQKMTVFATHSS